MNLSNLFIAQSEKPPHLQPVDLDALAPFHRALLTIDGTVTQFITAYTLEPIEVQLIDQQTRRLSANHVWLGAPEGTTVIDRQVLLQSPRNQEKHARIYAYAISSIVRDRLPDDVQQGLYLGAQGLGALLHQSQMETRRELLWYGREQMRDDAPDALQHLRHEMFLSRTYRIIADGKPMMLITEKFPCSVADSGSALRHIPR